MSLIDHKQGFHVERDACGDAFVRCAPTSSIRLAEASVFDNGPDKFDVWVFETARPVATAKAIIATLARRGFAATRGQTGDREVIVQVRHDGNRAREAEILRLVHAKTRRKLSDAQKARLAEASKPFRFPARHASQGTPGALESKISS
jgi:hypothetical protein